MTQKNNSHIVTKTLAQTIILGKMENSIIGIIPARIGSTRLPGKALQHINGKPLIAYVIEAALSSKRLDAVIVATDDNNIYKEAEKCGAIAVMTAPELPSGSDRIFNALQQKGLMPTHVLNIQGDEIFITGNVLDELIAGFIKSEADCGTLISKIDDKAELFNPSVVKVSLKNNTFANYFSRHTIPFLRDVEKDEWLNSHTFYKHIGIYAYKYKVLEQFVALPQSDNEKAEKLEQLRLLDNGYNIHCHETDAFLFGIDTPEDLKRAEEIIKNSGGA